MLGAIENVLFTPSQMGQALSHCFPNCFPHESREERIRLRSETEREEEERNGLARERASEAAAKRLERFETSKLGRAAIRADLKAKESLDDPAKKKAESVASDWRS